MSTGRARVAVLSKKDPASRPYAAWLAQHGIEVVLVAEDGAGARRALAPQVDSYAEVVLVDDWKANRLVDMAVVDAHRRTPLTRIVSLSEADVVRAAQLREWLGLPGQTVASATAFRDKVVMKDLAAAAGIGVPRYRRVDSAWDLLDFVDETGFPVVVKPVDGAGALDVTTIGDQRELAEWVGRQSLRSDEPARMMVEEWVDVPMMTVDGVMAGGRILVAMVNAYHETCYATVARLATFAMSQVDRGSDRYTEALDFARRLVAGLPTPDEPTAFHCELFAHPARGLLLCEIAARAGGGRIREMVAHAIGVDLEQWTCLGQAGVSPDDLLDMQRPVADDYVGFLGVPKPGRRLRSVPDACPLPGVTGYTVRARPGECAARATKVSQFCVDLLVHGTDAEELRFRSERVTEWLGRELVWEDDPALVPQPTSPSRASSV
jgi:hypothetical protein